MNTLTRSIGEEYGLKYIKLILNGKTLSADGSDDPETMPFLEIADQKGNPLKIPHEEKKRKQHDDALCHLLQADEQFGCCGSALLATVDNYAVLQLDIGSCGREEVLFLRLYLLQSLLSYIEGNDSQASLQLQKVESLYSRLSPDAGKMAQLVTLGFTEREARLSLRACQGDIEEAAMHIANRRQALKEQERNKSRRRLEGVAVLKELGYSRRDASRALHKAEGDVDKAYAILVDTQTAVVTNNNTETAVSQELVQQ
ncbi:hypothetical protein CRUP_031242, partial [Coryphaenoides rupestris]